MAKKLVPALAGTIAIGLVAGSAWASSAFAATPITLSVDGASEQVQVRGATVGEALADRGITVGAHDVVTPGLDTPLVKDLSVSVLFARPLEVTIDGEKKTVWTTATTVEDALAQLDLGAAANKLSTSRSAAIGREGLSLSIATAKDVTVTLAGKPTPLTIAGTVGDALAKLGITPDADDIVTPALDSQLEAGSTIVYKKIDVTNETRTVEVPFDKQTTKSDALYVGESKIVTNGVKGSATQEVRITLTDGTVTDTQVVTSTTTKAPVAEVRQVGTKPRPAASSPSSNLAPASGASCQASYYWQGQRTANGEWFNTNDFTAAHKSLPFNTKVKVTNVANGRTTVVRINDRGPYIAGRCLDLSTAAMSAIGGTGAGVVTVTYEVVG